MKVQVIDANTVDLRDVLDRSPHAYIAGAEHTLGFCYRMSAFSWAGTVDGQVACVWGLIPPTMLSDQAYLWLIVTGLVSEHQFIFIRHSQRCIELMLNKYESIVGHCERGAKASQRWLRWLGAEFGYPDEKKIPFTIRKK